MKRKLNKLIDAGKKITGKKHHLDFIVATLTIPVLLSVIILNYFNLQNIKKNTEINKPTPSPVEKIIVVPQKNQDNKADIIPECIKDIGPISISFPKEGQTISDNPLCINIKYSDASYCSVVWSYKINNSSWSEFSGNNPCIYNLPQGNNKFELRIQSTVKQKEEALIRNFIYKWSDINQNQTATQSSGL